MIYDFTKSERHQPVLSEVEGLVRQVRYVGWGPYLTRGFSSPTFFLDISD